MKRRTRLLKGILAGVILGAVLNVSVVDGVELSMAWDAPSTFVDGNTISGLTGYKVCYGTDSGVYSNTIQVNEGNSVTVTGLEAGRTYYFVVKTCCGTNESSASAEIAWSAPEAPGTNTNSVEEVPPVGDIPPVADIPPSVEPGSIQGTISCEDTNNIIGRVVVCAFSNDVFDVAMPVAIVELSEPGAYTLALPPGAYYSVASKVSGRRNQADYTHVTDAWGVYGSWTSPVPVTVVSGQAVGQVDIVLAEGSSSNRNPLAFLDCINDFDGDGETDFFSYNAKLARWFFRASTNGLYTVSFGFKGTLPITGDFDGDEATDIGVYDAKRGTSYMVETTEGFKVFPLGFKGTINVTGDFDGDGVTDCGIYNPSKFTWIITQSSTGGIVTNVFGFKKAIPVTGDFDGDGVTDRGVYYAATGVWYILGSEKGLFITQVGPKKALPVMGDFDGDGLTDCAVYYAARGEWHIFGSEKGFYTVKFGYKGTIPTTGDYDGDGITDLALYRLIKKQGEWIVAGSSEGFFTTQMGVQ